MRSDEVFAKFDAAMESLARATPPNWAKSTFTLLSALLKNSMRFYLPDSRFVLDTRQFDNDTKSMLRLPFDCVALLSRRDTRNRSEISIAFDPRGATNAKFGIINPSTLPIDTAFVVTSIIHASEYKMWVPLLGFGGVTLPADRLGVDVRGYHPPQLNDSGINMSAELMSDVWALTNLFAMLSLHNVLSAKREPPERLNRSRAIRGKRPLYSYHVLEVDGEAWDDDPREGAGTGAGIRSHLRRGHIRRLDESRRVWVRATYVHGSVPGFVDKDYRVEVPHAEHAK
jgi:hypothetical protein